MKTATVLLASCIAACVSTSTAADAPVNVTSSSTTSPTAQVMSNSSVIKPQGDPYWYWYCERPSGAVTNFWRLTKKLGPYDCTVAPLARDWTMLSSYRDGGVENVHWKYTNNVNDPECMENWNYHAADGRTLKTCVAGRTTTYGQNRRWCGLPVYNDGGVEGYQWAYCTCRWDWA